MAQYRCSVKDRLSRGKGASVARAAAYITREKLDDERTGEHFDFSRKNDKALWSGIYAPKDAPAWAHDLQKLTAEIERAEKRKDSQLALPLELSLAHELTLEQNRWMLQDFIKENYTRQGYVAIAAIHEPPHGGDEKNIHAHLLVPLRKIDGDGFAKDKKEQQENYMARSKRVEALRESWEKHLKRHLERHGFEKEAQEVSCKSLAAQGIDREPTTHKGRTATEMERRGEQSERGDANREIEARNKERERLKAEVQEIEKQRREIEARPEKELARRTVGYNILDEAREAAKARRELIAERAELRKLNEGKFREALGEAQSGVDLMILLQDRDLQLARNKWGQFVAVPEKGFSVAAPIPENLREDLATLEREGVLIPTETQVKEEQKQARADEREKRREAYLEKQKEWEKRKSRRAAKMYDHADMASQQGDALRHHAEKERAHKKAFEREQAEQKEREQAERRKREEEALKRLDAKEAQQKEREEERRKRAAPRSQEQQRREQSAPTAFAGRKSEGQARREDRAARTEQTDAKREKTQRDIRKEIFEKQWPKIERGGRDDDYGRERER